MYPFKTILDENGFVIYITYFYKNTNKEFSIPQQYSIFLHFKNL